MPHPYTEDQLVERSDAIREQVGDAPADISA